MRDDMILYTRCLLLYDFSESLQSYCSLDIYRSKDEALEIRRKNDGQTPTETISFLLFTEQRDL